MAEKVAIRAAAIDRAVLRIRGHNVMLDDELAALYDVQVRALNQAVKRNRERFPPDFMFRLTSSETQSLRSQTVIAKSGSGGRRTSPYAFTEQGVAMLSTVLRSERAVLVKHRDHARICTLAPDPGRKRGALSQARCAGTEVRHPV
jgi:hypothetical protein